MTCPHFQTLSALSLGVAVVYENLFPNNGLVKIYATQNRKVSGPDGSIIHEEVHL